MGDLSRARRTDRSPRPWLALVAWLAAAGLAHADLVLERTVRDRRTGPLGDVSVCARRERVWLGERRVLIEDLVFGRDLLVQLDRGMVFEIDRPGRRARSSTFDERAAWRRQLAAELAEAGQRVAGSALEADLAAVLALLSEGDPGGAPLTIRNGSDSAQACGLEVQPVLLERGRTRVALLWLANGRPAGAALLQAYERLGWLPVGCGEALGTGGALPLRFEGTLIDQADRVERTEVVTRVAEQAVPPDRYEVPEGFAAIPAAGPALAALPDDPPGGREDGDAPADTGGAPAEPPEKAPRDRDPDRPARPDRGRR